jgi:hypothetical protein
MGDEARRIAANIAKLPECYASLNVMRRVPGVIIAPNTAI